MSFTGSVDDNDYLELTGLAGKHWEWFQRYIFLFQEQQRELFELMQKHQEQCLNLIGPDQFRHGEKHGREDANAGT